jgi:tripartite-type tricarboxylate transporter receptor subunit TctC
MKRTKQLSLIAKLNSKRSRLVWIIGLWIVSSYGLVPQYQIAPHGIGTVYAQSKPFYEGKTIKVVIGPSGGYDYWGRLLARYMEKHIPGNPSFIVQNMPGAGSVIATNYVYNIAKPDGLTVGMPTQQIYMGEFVGRVPDA